MKKGISVIIPCYKAGEYLKQTVESVIDQKCPYPYEIIIADDNPKNEQNDRAMLEIMELAERKGVDLRVVTHRENKGDAGARNTALKAAEYEFIFPVDADDLLVPPSESEDGIGYMQKAYELMAENEKFDVVFSDMENFGAYDSLHTFPEFDPKMFLERCTIWISGMYRRGTALAMGGYDESLRHVVDFAFWARMLQYKEQRGEDLNVYKIAEPLYRYRRFPKDGEWKHASAETVNDHVRGWKLMVGRFPDLYKKYFPDAEFSELPEKFHHNELIREGKLRVSEELQPPREHRKEAHMRFS